MQRPTVPLWSPDKPIEAHPYYGLLLFLDELEQQIEAREAAAALADDPKTAS